MSFAQTHRRYHEMEVLGRGSFGEVQRCFDSYLNRVVARKSLHEEKGGDAEHLLALIQEARLISYLEHPGVISIFDGYVEEDGLFCYTMKQIEGKSLESILAFSESQGKSLPLSRCVEILQRVSETLAYVHDKGVLHLDMKPQNIMLGAYGEVSVVDWGTARLFEPDKYFSHLQTYGVDTDELEWTLRERRIEGTPPYMPPELLQQPVPPLTPGADIFSIGVLFYRMLTGRSPFALDDLSTYFRELREHTPALPHQLRGDVPLRLSQICAKMLEKDVTKRYQSLHDVLRDVRSYAHLGLAFQLETYPANTVLIREGEFADRAFLILDGFVEIYKETDGETVILATRERGEVVGELSMLQKNPRSASARTLTPTTVKILTVETVDEEITKLDPWVGQMLYNLSHKLSESYDFILSYSREVNKK